jgi:hypothetical protein
MSRQQEREQWKSREGVVRQLRFDQRHNDENDGRSRDQIIIDGVALSPEMPGQSGQFDRPWEKAEEDPDKIE